jgi:hypothetical protein
VLFFFSDFFFRVFSALSVCKQAQATKHKFK